MRPGSGQVGASVVTPLPFELAELRCFVVLSETLHFGRAAARLNMTQPPLSRRIALLEEKLGVRLVERGNGSARMTPAGLYFVHEARTILRRAEESVAETRLAAEGMVGTLTIGFTSSVAYVLLPNLIALHKKNNPGIAFVLKEHMVEEQLRLLDAGTLDVAIVRPPIDVQLYCSFTVTRDRWAFALPTRHPLARRTSIPLTALRDQAYIAWPPTAAYAHLNLESIFHAAGISPRKVVAMTQPTAILSMVRAGLGVALVPSAMAHLGMAGVALRAVDPAGIDPAMLTLDSIIVWRRNAQLPTVQRLVETARELQTSAIEAGG